MSDKTLELADIEAMEEDEAAMLQSALEDEGLEAFPIGFPSFLRMSGLYRAERRRWPGRLEAQEGEEEETGAIAGRHPFPFLREDFRLDVDGPYPQMTASGTLRRLLTGRVHWIASLRRRGRTTWTGRIWYKDGATASFPYTTVKITAVRSFFPHLRKAIVRFSGGGAPTRKVTFRFASQYYHPVEFEYDHETGAAPTLQVDTCAHPNRPASLPCETLTIEKVFQRAGFQAVRNAGGTTAIPTDGPDPNTTWSDAEMHDAMQTYWSRFANKPQWSLWVLFAKQHDWGHGLGGIMFDDIGPNHRQGTAIFTDSFISDAPAGDPDPADWVKRNHFWTAVHEMGHAFNLAHSWQKSLGAPYGTPWIPLADEPEARSFMNYPYGVAGGESAFFADFEYRFSDGELLFMRHAPERFVQMGNADWFDHHGFQDAAIAPSADFALRIGTERDGELEFLEPAVLKLEVVNISNEPKMLPAELLLDTAHLAVVIKKEGKPARRWSPYAQYCPDPEKTVLQPGESLSESLFAAVGTNGWDLAEPGHYTVQAAMEIDGRAVVSNPLRLRIAAPKSREEEHLAQDVLTEAAGRVMAFDGSKVLTAGVNAWQEVVARMPDSKAAIHGRVALAMPMTRNYRVLRVDAPPMAAAMESRAAFKVAKAKPDEGRKELTKALIDDAETAVATLGREDYEYYCGHFATWLKESGGESYAKKAEQVLKMVVAQARTAPPAKSKGKGKKEKVKV